MIKKRLIPKLELKQSDHDKKGKMVLVTSVNFKKYIEVGDVVSQAKIFQDQVADELLFVDIDASLKRRNYLLIDIIRAAAEEIFMPFTVGGGVQSIDDIRLLLLNGADKVSINTSAVNDPDLINKAANIFGSQCIVLSIDFKASIRGEFKVWTSCGNVQTDLNPREWAKECEKRGAGEILLTSIDRDGTRTGLELELIRKVADSVTIPVIASGGCGLASHFIDGFVKGRVDAVSAGTYFCFKDENIMQVRSQIKNSGIPIRIHT